MIKSTLKKMLFIFVLGVVIHPNQYAQTEHYITLPEIWKLTLEKSTLLKISDKQISIVTAEKECVKNLFLPNIQISFGGSFISNGILMDRNFDNIESITMPHFGNDFSFTATQVLFAGGAFLNQYENAKLSEKIAKLNYESKQLDICFLMTAYYLDLIKLKNQTIIFQKNMDQTQLIIDQIKSKEANGVVLKNDVTRHELQLQNLKIAKLELENQIKIITREMCTILDLERDQMIIPDSTLVNLSIPSLELHDLVKTAIINLPELKIMTAQKEMAQRSIKIAKSGYYPRIQLQMGNYFNGPILVELPTINKNFNYGYVGLGIQYDISSLYKNHKNVNLSQNHFALVLDEEKLLIEEKQNAVYNSYVFFQESIEKIKVYEKNVTLAEENYEVIYNRYNNDLALITEMMDASNTKLYAELELINGKLNIIYQYYKIQREMGIIEK
jgi:outer membrane protein